MSVYRCNVRICFHTIESKVQISTKRSTTHRAGPKGHPIMLPSYQIALRTKGGEDIKRVPHKKQPITRRLLAFQLSSFKLS